MKDKKGFTLIELLAVIVIIGIVSSIATVGIMAVRSSINESLLETKIEIIEEGAALWGEDNKILLVKNDIPSGNYVSYSDSDYGYAAYKTINELSGYINAGDTCEDGSICVKNDVDGSNMGEEQVYIYVLNNRVYATYQGVNGNSD